MDKAITQIAGIVHSHPDNADDAVHLARLVLLHNSRRVAKMELGAKPQLPINQLQGLCAKLRSFDTPRAAQCESGRAKCWRLCTLGRLLLLLGQEHAALTVLQVRRQGVTL
eukprot:COSAG01_NODE_2486_length_7593_cov_2.425674_4_plen_111_part_00